MNQLFETLFSQYSAYSALDIVLELTAVFFGVVSVLYAKKNNVLVYPSGIIGSAIFVYLLIKWGLFGDFIINIFYVVMSVYGWYLWTRKAEGKNLLNISQTNRKEKIIASIIFITVFIFIWIIYIAFDKFDNWTAYVDTLTTAIFFSGMWLMAKRKIENWIFWIVGDIITIPLYFYKGLTMSSFLYLIYTFIAIAGYLAWRKSIEESKSLKLEAI
jgi:nicotinamide mononucleotide transporter